MKPSRSLPRPISEQDCVVQSEHLEHVDNIRSLLGALNDPYASGHKIAKLVAEIPVLAARCVRRAGRTRSVEVATIEHALSLIGNRGLEAELLGVLEDLTLLKAQSTEDES